MTMLLRPMQSRFASLTGGCRRSALKVRVRRSCLPTRMSCLHPSQGRPQGPPHVGDTVTYQGRQPCLGSISCRASASYVSSTGEALPLDIETALAALAQQRSSGIPGATTAASPPNGFNRPLTDGRQLVSGSAATAVSAPSSNGAAGLPNGYQSAVPSDGDRSTQAGVQKRTTSDPDRMPTVPAAAAAAILDAAVALPDRADVLVTDMLDHRCRPAS